MFGSNKMPSGQVMGGQAPAAHSADMPVAVPQSSLISAGRRWKERLLTALSYLPRYVSPFCSVVAFSLKEVAAGLGLGGVAVASVVIWQIASGFLAKFKNQDRQAILAHHEAALRTQHAQAPNAGMVSGINTAGVHQAPGGVSPQYHLPKNAQAQLQPVQRR